MTWMFLGFRLGPPIGGCRMAWVCLGFRLSLLVSGCCMVWMCLGFKLSPPIRGCCMAWMCLGLRLSPPVRGCSPSAIAVCFVCSVSFRGESLLSQVTIPMIADVVLAIYTSFIACGGITRRCLRFKAFRLAKAPLDF